MKRSTRIILGLLFGLLVLSLIAPAIYRRYTLSFITIANDSDLPLAPSLPSGLLSYQQQRPFMAVIAKPEEIADFTGSILTQKSRYADEIQVLSDHLQAVDYDQYFVILVLQGYTSPNDNVNILQVFRQDDQVIVWARVNKPPPNTGLVGVLVSPFHLVKVAKTGIWMKQVKFTLMYDLQQILETTHFIP